MDSVKNLVCNRKNSFEVFGYDLMLDEDLNSWLIEVNSSPDMTYSTYITEKLVKEMSEDIVKLTIDENLLGAKGRDLNICGNWELIDNINLDNGKVKSLENPNENLI